MAAEGRVLTSLGLTAWRLGDYGRARVLGEEALALKRAEALDGLLFRSFNALGLLAWSEGRFFDAIDLYESAFEAAGRQGDTASLAKASNNLALVLNDVGDFERAEHYFVEALEGGRVVADTLIQGRVLNNLGMVAHQVGDPRQAIEYLGEARRLYADVGDVTGDQNALGQLGAAYAALGSPGDAIAYLDSALALSRRHGLRQEEASNLELLAGVYAEAGDARRALSLLEDAADIDAELGLDFEAGVVLRRRAEILARLGALEEAERAASEALALHASVEAGREQLSDLILLAELAEERAEPEEADARLASAEEIAAALGSRAARVELALAWARLAESREDWAGVGEALEPVDEDLHSGGFREEWEASALRARARSRAGDREGAVEDGRRAVRAVERVRSGYGAGTLRTSFLAARQRTYVELVTALLALGRSDEAFGVADRARGRALVEHVAAAGEAAGAARRLAEGERLLRQIDTLVVRLDESREWGDPPEVQERLADELAAKRSEYEDLLERAEAEGGGARLLVGPGADPAVVASALEPGEALLQYLVGDDRIVLFVVTPEDLRVLEKPADRESLFGRIRLARDLMSRPAAGASATVATRGASGADAAAGPLLPVLERLHDELLGPARDAGLLTGRDRLIVVPHAELSYVPFAALLDRVSGRYAAEDHALVHLPSSEALPTLRQARPGASTEGLEQPASTAGRAVAFAPYPGQLPATAEEVRAVEQALDGTRVRVGRRADEASFRAALAAAPVVHAATHGVFNRTNPMFTRIELARDRASSPSDDGRFELHELMSLRLPGSLVFLSGCETGLGASWSTDFAPGEDYATLSQAFLWAGARNVVATLWRIEDEGAAAFAAAFYEALKDRGPADALAEARRVLMKSGEFAAPFYWAGYRLSGA